MTHVSKRDVLKTAALCFLCALAAFSWAMWQDGGALTIVADFDSQQLPFTMALHNQIARGGLAGWCWNLDLGASAIQGFGFYELGSPFFWASMVFPSSWFPYVVGWLYILKYVVAGVLAHVFISRFVSRPQSATVGALLYAFSGFQTTNLMFYHFHDVVALFPLLLIGLEELMDERGHACFVVAVAINCLVNYFFFVQSAVFLLAYFAFRFAPRLARRGRRQLASALLRCLACGALGAGMAGVLLLPSAYYMLRSARASMTALGLRDIAPGVRQLLFLVQGFLLPGDAMGDHNAVGHTQYLSTSCWLPLVGPSLAFSYVRRGHTWLARLLVPLAALSFSPVLSSVFLLFKGDYQRWWYALTLMAALASAHVVDDADRYDIRWGAVATTALVTCFACGIALVERVAGGVLFHPLRFVGYAAIGALGPLVGWRLLCGFESRRPEQQLVGFLAVTAFVAASTTAITLYCYRACALGNTLQLIEVGTKLPALDARYRYAMGENRLTLPGDAAGTSGFSSTVSVGAGRLEELFGQPAGGVHHLDKESVAGLSELLAGRYVLSQEQTAGEEALSTIEVAGTRYSVTERAACPIGIVFGCYCLIDDLLGLDADLRGLALLQAPVVYKTDEPLVSRYARRVGVDDLELGGQVADLVARASAAEVSCFQRGDWGFSCLAELSGPGLAYFAVPNDEGWSIMVDDKACSTVDSAGMMLLPLDAGKHVVVARYETPWLRVGAIVSGVSISLFVVLSLRRGMVHRQRSQESKNE